LLVALPTCQPSLLPSAYNCRSRSPPASPINAGVSVGAWVGRLGSFQPVSVRTWCCVAAECWRGLEAVAGHRDRDRDRARTAGSGNPLDNHKASRQ
jgi:hypothetical protein